MEKAKSIALILGVLVTSVFVSCLVLAWTEPSSAPPAGNVAAPLNTSINAQAKEGALILGANPAVTTGLIVQNGDVGIGTTGPNALLNLKGTLSSALTGTVAVTNLSTAVVGTGTLFTTELAVGDSIKISAEVFTVSAITDALNLTLDSAYQGATASGLTAYRDPTLFAVDNGDAVNKLTITRSGNVGIGTTTPTTGKLVVSGGNIDVTGNKVINVAAPIDTADAATKGYVDSKISTYTSCRGVCGENDVGCAGNETRVALLSNGSGCQTTPAFFDPSLGTGTVVFEVKTSSTGCFQCGDFYPNRCQYDYETLYFNNQQVATSILCFSAVSSTLGCPGTNQPSSCAVCCK